jgi:hypothetical protein
MGMGNAEQASVRSVQSCSSLVRGEFSGCLGSLLMPLHKNRVLDKNFRFSVLGEIYIKRAKTLARQPTRQSWAAREKQKELAEWTKPMPRRATQGGKTPLGVTFVFD